MDDLVKRLLTSEEGWYEERAPNTPQEARNSVWRDAAARIQVLEAALKEFACSCPSACERERNNAYAGKDSSCRAHDALNPPAPAEK